MYTQNYPGIHFFCVVFLTWTSIVWLLRPSKKTNVFSEGQQTPFNRLVIKILGRYKRGLPSLTDE